MLVACACLRCHSNRADKTLEAATCELGLPREKLVLAKLALEGREEAAREQGLSRAEGKEYVVQDGDVLLFRFNT